MPRPAVKPPPTAGVRLGRGRRPRAPALRDAKDALYREHLMEVAERIFAEQGFARTRMQDIAAAAGVSLNTLYASWPGKQDLYRGLLIARDRQMLDCVLARTRPLQVPQTIEQLLWLMETQLHFWLQHPDYLRMQLHEGYAWYHRSAQPTADEQQIWERGLAVLVQTFTWGAKQGMLCPGNPRHQAHLLLALQQTRLANWVMDGMREEHDAVVERIQADFLRQFSPPKVAARLLTGDGARLSGTARRKIRALD